MSDAVAAVKPVQSDQDAEAAALNAGYADESAPPTPTPAKEDVAPPTPPVADDPEVKPEPKPEPVQLTKEQIDKLLTTASEVDGLKAAMKQKFDETFGRLGSLQETVKKVQVETPSGQVVTLTREDFPTLVRDFGPELADSILEGLNKKLGQAKVAGTAPAQEPKPDTKPAVKPVEAPTPSDQPDPVKIEEMTALREDWQQIVGVIGPNGEPPPSTPFRQWLAIQPADYRAKIEKTDSPIILNAAIAKFEAATKDTKPEPKPDPPDPRRLRKEAAVQPKGAGGGTATGQTEKDGFTEGYNDA